MQALSLLSPRLPGPERQDGQRRNSERNRRDAAHSGPIFNISDGTFQSAYVFVLIAHWLVLMTLTDAARAYSSTVNPSLSSWRALRDLNDSQVLTGDDENRLIAISHEMGKAVAEALGSRDFARAAEIVRRLQNLVAIDHATVKRLLAEAWEKVRHFFRAAGDKIKADCHFTRFEHAEEALEVIEEASSYFEGDVTAFHELRDWYEVLISFKVPTLSDHLELSIQSLARQQR